MKIMPLANINYQKKKHSVQTNTISNSLQANKLKLSFGAYCDEYRVEKPKKSFDPLNTSTEGIKQLGEVFHEHDGFESLCRRQYSDGGLFGKYENSAAYKAYQRLLTSVNTAKNHKNNVLSELNPILQRKTLGEGDMLDKKIEFKQNFLTMLELEKKGKKPPIYNGILLYGSSRKKDEFIEWIKNEAKASFKEIYYNENEPFNSIKNIVSASQDAQRVYEHTGNRTVLFVKNLDKLLTNQDDENLLMIGRFKSFVENAAQNYHTTILMKTDLPLNDFEDASIGTQRFGCKIKLTSELSPKDENRINELSTELTRLKNMTQKVHEYTWIDTEYCYSTEGHLP